MLNELVKYNKDWYNIAYSFLRNKEDAEDIIQEMYIMLDRYNVKLERITYKDEINKYFMYRTIKNMCLQFIDKKKYHLDLDEIQIDEAEESDDESQAYNRILDKVNDVMNTWSYYDKTIFEMYMYSGLSMRSMSYGTSKKARKISNRKFIGDKAVKDGNKISVSSMFNTIKKCRLKLKEELGEDFEDYFNNDFDKI